MSANDDFSFVRFLKVVKTLYESSTFTQLGKTVGSALNPLSPSADLLPEIDNNNRSNKKNGKKKNRGNNSKSNYNSPTSDSIFEALTDACTSSNRKDIEQESLKGAISSDKTLQRKETIFDQMIKGCTLLATPEDDFSDEETFKTRTEDDLSFYSGVDQSYESVTEDEYESRTRQRRRR